jgi:hypothetical protein
MTRRKKLAIGATLLMWCSKSAVTRLVGYLQIVTLGMIQLPALAQPDHAEEYLRLANKFAPQIVYSQAEPNLPASVEWFLLRTGLSVHDAGCVPTDVDFGLATIVSLKKSEYKSPCRDGVVKASGTRSASRSHTFVLRDVSDADKHGSSDTADWPLYLHTFRNALGGWALQYWCFYAFNTGKTILWLQIGFHGGDWEMFQVDTDSNGTPRSVAMTGHTKVESAPWSAVPLVEGTHPVVYAERGGHEMHLQPQEPPPYIRRGTWPNSMVVGKFLPGGASTSPGGPIIDVGSRLHPLVGFLNYSGLWGSLGKTRWSSGYWGAPFNETQMPQDGFLFAWCFNIKDPGQIEGNVRECYPDNVQ